MPPFVVATGAYFANHHETRRVGVERFSDELVDDVRALVLGGVDVVDSGVDGFSEQQDGVVGVGWWSEHAWAG
jgi:hypothetical protein